MSQQNLLPKARNISQRGLDVNWESIYNRHSLIQIG